MKHNQKGSTLIIVLVIIIILLVVGGIYYMTSKPQSTNLVQTTTDRTGTKTVATTTDKSIQSGTVSQVKLYYVDLNDNGKNGMEFGCNDSLVPVVTSIAPTQAPLQVSLEALFADHNQYEGTNTNVMNSLYMSRLKVDSASVSNGVANVKISGTTQLGGVCDDPRFVNQIKYTVLQFPTVTSTNITVNGRPLDNFLSEKGN